MQPGQTIVYLLVRAKISMVSATTRCWSKLLDENTCATTVQRCELEDFCEDCALSSYPRRSIKRG